MRTAAMDDYFFNELKSHPTSSLLGAGRLDPAIKRGYYQITMILLPLHNPHKAQSHKPNCLINPGLPSF